MFIVKIKTPERRQHTLHLVLAFFFVNFEHVIAGWIMLKFHQQYTIVLKGKFDFTNVNE